MQLLLDALATALLNHYRAPLQRLNSSPLVPVRTNYDAPRLSA